MTKKPNIVFIGSGNLATQLSLALKAADFHILQVYSRTETSAKTLADKLQCDYTTHPGQLSPGADLYICALKDAVITEVLDQAFPIIQGKNLVHTAGSISMEILEKYTPNRGVLYPMQTFTKAKKVGFSKVPFLSEGANKQITDLLEFITCFLSKKVFFTTSEDRKKIHLAAVFACNFANHAYALGGELAKAAGVPFEVLLPLIEETAEKVHSIDPISAQSGPAVRDDKNVLSMHEEMLKENPTMLDVYKVMSKSIHELAIKSHNV